MKGHIGQNDKSIIGKGSRRSMKGHIGQKKLFVETTRGFAVELVIRIWIQRAGQN